MKVVAGPLENSFCANPALVYAEAFTPLYNSLGLFTNELKRELGAAPLCVVLVSMLYNSILEVLRRPAAPGCIYFEYKGMRYHD